MFLDDNTEFSDSQAVTATAISDVMDLGANPTVRDLGEADDLELVIQCDEAAAAAGAATVQFSLESDSTADLATSPTVHWQSAAIAKTTLVAGYEVARLRVPKGDYERYLGVRYTVATGPLTAGKFSAFLTPASQSNKKYPSGFTVS